ncbi:unnamed protein product [Orchesella dallaii]|uniref:Uncharacterized protein n=1 Tax=Orchesella dallaii TaxID=48710 RepID=A0ABP1PKP3_9HEXA
MVTLPLSLECDPIRTSVTIICRWYCSSKPIPFLDFQKAFETKGLVLLHRHLFWNGKGKVIPGFIARPFRHPTVKSKNCTRMPFIPICRTDLMLFLTFMHIHNLSIPMYEDTSKNQRVAEAEAMHYGTESLSTSFFINTSLSLSFVALHEFDSFDSLGIFYCTKLKEGERNFLAFAVWYEPFTLGIWVGVLIIIGFSCFYSFKHYRKSIYFVFVELVGYVGNIFGASTKARYFVFSCAVGFLLSQIYANGLTSIITVFLPPKGLDTMKQFLDAGFKILFVPTTAALPAEHEFAQDFKRLRLPIEKAFHTVHNVNVTTVDDLLLFMAGNNRYGFTHKTSLIKSTIGYATSFLQTIYDPSSTCFVLHDTLQKTEINWIFKTENKQHLTTTLNRIVTSGLYFKWDEWSEWNFMLKKMLLEQHTPAQSDVIDIRKFASIFFVWISFILFCLGVFAAETRAFTFLIKIILGSYKNRIIRIRNIPEMKKRRERSAQEIFFRPKIPQQRSGMVRDMI